MNKTATIAILAGSAGLLAWYLSRPKEGGTEADFLAYMRAIAPEIERKYGIKQNITVDQAALESDLGQSGLAKGGLNLYGIKVSKAWAAANKPVWTGRTEEFLNNYLGIPTSTMITDGFKKYQSWRESVYDWADLISGIYKTAYTQAKSGDLTAYGNAIYKTGYSTHPRYAALLEDMNKRISAMG